MVLLNGKNIIKGAFPNGETHYIDFVPSIGTRNGIKLIYENNSDLFNVAMLKKAIDNYGHSERAVLLMDFCPYGQMDRPIDGSLFSFKYFAQFINDLKFDKVYICDPHSRVIEAAINNCDISYPMAYVNTDNYDLFFYPDAGAAAKYSSIYDKPYRYGNKKRNLNTGEILYYEVVAEPEDIVGKKILMRDDICLKGRTFKEAAKVLHEMGAAKIDLHITHLMPVAEEFYKNHKDFYIDNFYSENTLEMPWYKEVL